MDYFCGNQSKARKAANSTDYITEMDFHSNRVF